MAIAIDMSEYCVYPRTPYPRTPLTATRNRRNFDSSHVAIDRHASTAGFRPRGACFRRLAHRAAEEAPASRVGVESRS